MLVLFKRFFRSLIRKIRVYQARNYQGIYLPTTRSNELLSSDEDYINSTFEQIDTIRKYTEIDQRSRILDFGCGQGRFALGLILAVKNLGQYIGIDTDYYSIQWCQRWIHRFHPEYSFIHVPAYNARYNPKSTGRQKLPLDPTSLDIVFLNSVFSHMLKDDVEFYLQEFGELLRPGGILYTTAFLESGVPDVEENPQGYLGKESTLPLHRVRYEKEYFLHLVKMAGIETISFEHRGIQRTGQSVIIGKKNKLGTDNFALRIVK
jgi:SAM-dependent methyltransferase